MSLTQQELQDSAMSLSVFCFVFCIIAIFILLIQSVKSIHTIKKIILVFWLIMLILLLYGMLFISNQNLFYLMFYRKFYFVFLIFLLGIVSVILENKFNNISIFYFLFYYFGIPIIYTAFLMQSLVARIITVQTFLETSIVFAFFVFAFLSIVGFVAWIKEKYVLFKGCFVACIFFYCPFLFIGGIVLGWLDK